ncbi:hypothetical protein BFJ65_g14820 [Fusarium oxysporum f. sp. cepae]|uniref:Uncharacterized protein n=1 Tax=Fusarium oxysporum f. sp. cepae TaxID=396571 RepID=A0A3L6N2P5_FUSOX|nr:hypothetical protein BFJ65_g14820 [Fusarium oxysporum f. sp. cepae]
MFSLLRRSDPREQPSAHEMANYPLDWDQAGFALVWPTAELPNPDADHPGDANTAPLYVKTGVETFQGKTWGSTVANKREVDWSLYPLSEGQDTQSVTIEVVKYGERLGTMLVRKKRMEKKPRILPGLFPGALRRTRNGSCFGFAFTPHDLIGRMC